MASMPIKSGTDIVNEFLKSLEGDSDIDADTLDAVRHLVSSESLTFTRLLQRLEELRMDNLKPAESHPPEEDHDS